MLIWATGNSRGQPSNPDKKKRLGRCIEALFYLVRSGFDSDEGTLEVGHDLGRV